MPVYASTNRAAPPVDLGQALLLGQAPDRGLYLPRPLPRFADGLLGQARDLPYAELATRILEPFAAGTFDRDELAAICHDAYDFAVPVEPAGDDLHVLRLDRGPTASFKDFAARFMARALGRLVRARGGELVILTATSGDTGSAVAHAFHHVPGIRVVVLFPIDEVSRRQRLQMTTLGGNISTLAVSGKFDDCQALVKRAFADPELERFPLSSANSINIGRLLPQSVYYVHAAAQVVDLAAGEPIVFAVPSGNFGDMMGGLLAWRMGLPIRRLVIATNANDEVPRFLATGRYEKIDPSRQCLSNAMNVGHPSNLARVVDLYGGQMDETGRVISPPDFAALNRDLFAISVDDARTRATIGEVWRTRRVLLEPHGAVGFAGLLAAREADPELARIPALSLETAHPAKFPEAVRAETGVEPAVPPSLEGLEDRAEHCAPLDADYAAFKAYLQKELAS